MAALISMAFSVGLWAALVKRVLRTNWPLSKGLLRDAQVLLTRDFARIIRWDRAGAIVSERFNYVKNPEALLGLLWLYGQMDTDDRGLDDTAKPAGPALRKAYIAAIRRLAGM